MTIESAAVAAMDRGNFGKVARNLETVDDETIACVERSGARQDAEIALDLTPSELVVEGQPLGEQQGYFEALAHHGFDRQAHQRRGDALVPVLLEGEDGADAGHRNRLSVEVDGAIENLDGGNQLAAVTRDYAQRIAKA